MSDELSIDFKKISLEQLEDREFNLGDIVSVDGEGTGVIAATIDENTDFPVGEDETEEIEASSENLVYVVALMEGGSVAATTEEISSDATIEADGKDITSFEDIEEDADEAEMAEVYSYCDDPSSMAELEKAKKEMRRVDSSSDELLNIRGVDDPEVGFASMPNGWTRKSVLQAWASLGGTWRTCFARMVREFGPNGAKRFVSALKDEVLGTEKWRNRF